MVVGINDYQDPKIPKLNGAENDAKEVYTRLKNSDKYNFEISNNHLLLGKNATYLGIRNALNDLFWYPNNYDLILLYFSGNMYVDKYGKSYIVPYDMTTEAPFLRGLRMGELGDVIYQSPKNIPIMAVFDCCYSSDSIRKKESIFYAEEQFHKDLGARTKSNILFLSIKAGTNQKEISNCMHSNADNPHSHGILSFHFIKGLDSQMKIEVDNIHEPLRMNQLFKYVKEQISKEEIDVIIYTKKLNK